MTKKLLSIVFGLALALNAWATINFPASAVQYWVGSGSNSAVVVIAWDESATPTALAWGVHWNGQATALDLLDSIEAHDSRFHNGSTSGVGSLTYSDGTLSLTPDVNYWCYTVNGQWATVGYSGYTMTDGDLMEISDGCAFSMTTATAVTNPNGNLPVEATISASDILYWVGQGSNSVIMAVNWADTCLAWGYRFSSATVTVQAMMTDIAAADPRFSFVGSGFLDDIYFFDAAAGMTDTLRITPGNYWESTRNGVMDGGMIQALSDGDFEKWGDPAAGTPIDSTYVDNWGWIYTNVYTMTVHPVCHPDSSGNGGGDDPQPEHGPFCGAVGTEGCDAVAATSSSIVAWATGCTVVRGPQNIAASGSPAVTYGDDTMAIGPVNMNDNLTVVSLGDGGSATLTFARPITNGPGADFAVYENSFNDYFLELAFVEVSSDGQRFVRFPATSLMQTTTQVVSNVDPTYINNLAGKYRMGYGTPFDLEELRDSTGINIDSIVYVRLVDVVGSIDPQYATYDAFGHMVNDPWPTASYSSGFDLDGVAVMHQLSSQQGIAEAADVVSAVGPNPATDYINIAVTHAVKATLFDHAGRTVADVNLRQGGNRISLAGLASGIYILRAEGSAVKIIKR